MARFEWNYTGDPTNSSRDAVRWLVGDTIKARPLVSDKEVDYAISEKGSTLRSAAFVCDALAAKFASQADIEIGPIKKDLRGVAAAFTRRSRELRGDAASEVEAFFGGLTHSGKRDLSEDTDAVQPGIRKAGHDNRWAISDELAPTLFNFLI